MSKLEALSMAARLGGHIAWEKLSRPRPRTLASLPPSIEAITAEWLTAALCAGHAGAWVERFEFSRGSRGTTSRAAMQVQYNRAGQNVGLPTRLFVKMTPHLTSRLVCGLSGALASECGFHQKVRKGLRLEAPQAFYSAWDARSCRSAILFEDIATTRGCEFLNTEAHITRPQAEDMVRMLATLHAAYWASPRLDTEFTWLKTSQGFQENTNRLIDFETRTLIGITRGESVIPGELLVRRDAIWPAAMHSLELNSRAPLTYLHHDVHIGNWYRTREGRMGLTDFQCNVKGQWASDVAYALSSALQIEDRRSWERELLDLYLAHLAADGVPVPNREAAWLTYRQQQFHGYIFWLYTLGAGALQPAMQPDRYSLTNIQRMSQAIVDLDSLTALSQTPTS